ncbi:hypothetical protein J6590_021171 [Homalodisca vitripennis]|nr:hypothetical protein J6590_021171 [Homalodisca vitripennis]
MQKLTISWQSTDASSFIWPVTLDLRVEFGKLEPGMRIEAVKPGTVGSTKPCCDKCWTAVKEVMVAVCGYAMGCLVSTVKWVQMWARVNKSRPITPPPSTPTRRVFAERTLLHGQSRGNHNTYVSVNNTSLMMCLQAR